MQGAGFRVQGAGCRVQSSGCRVQGSEFRVQGSGCRVVAQVLAPDEVLLAAHAGPFASDAVVVCRLFLCGLRILGVSVSVGV